MSPDTGDAHSISAEQLMAELDADPAYAAQQEQQDRELQRKEAEWRKAEAPLVRELRDAGFDVDSAWDLVNTSTPYPEALPILLKHLRRPYPDRVREGIARALAVRDAAFAWDALAALYEQEEAGTDTKDGLAAALAAASTDAVVGDLAALVADTEHGDSRLLLLRSLEKSQDARARAALERLATDPKLGVEVRAILARSQ